MCKDRTDSGKLSSPQIKEVVSAGLVCTVTGPDPKHPGTVGLMVAQFRRVPATEAAQILAEQPSRAVEVQTLQPEGHSIISRAGAAAVADALGRKLPPGIAAVEPVIQKSHGMMCRKLRHHRPSCCRFAAAVV